MPRFRSVLVASALLMVLPAFTARLHAQGAACNAPSHDASVQFTVPGQPFQALPSADGCWIFASLTRTESNAPSIGVFARKDGTLSLVRTVPVAGGPTGMALTHDGQLLVVASGEAVHIFDVTRLQSGAASPLLGSLSGDIDRPGRVYANVSADDAYAFVSNERAMSITVIDLAETRRNKFRTVKVVGTIPVGSAPIALTFSNDGRWLYTTSQTVPPRVKWPETCRPQASNDPIAAPNHAEGALIVVDAKLAVTNPGKSVAGIVSAGCSPVRLVLSPDGEVAYVTARGDNAVLAFDTKRLLTDAAHARLGTVPVGTAPVGMAVVSEGRTLIVTNSNRFAGGADDKQSLSVLDASKIATSGAAQIGSIPAGAFPRELRVTADGKTLIATNFASRTIQMVDLARLDEAMGK